MNKVKFTATGGTMLTFEEKLAVIESFTQLVRNDVSLKRVNFQFEKSVQDRKNVIYHLHPNGNGFVYGQNLEGYNVDEKGLVNIRDFSAKDLRVIIQKSIESLSHETEDEEFEETNLKETWIDSEMQTLVLMQEYEMWNVYAGLNLEGTFSLYNEAAKYLAEEGFSLHKRE